MTGGGEYEPSPAGWVRGQVERILAAGDSRAVTLGGRPVVLVSMLGVSTGRVRKVPVMRVEHDGRYAVVASKGGSPRNPEWVANLRANPDVELLDGTEPQPMRARELHGAERDQWWARSVAEFPAYGDYQLKTTRLLPIFLLEPR
ncbi:MAG: nitroreductase family deazaflavin-dependent oxidoreductase [Dermatophilaceae bacterium]